MPPKCRHFVCLIPVCLFLVLYSQVRGFPLRWGEVKFNMGVLKPTPEAAGKAEGIHPLESLPRSLPEPHVGRGIYQLRNDDYFNVSRFDALPFGNWKHLVPFLQKLATGANVTIMVLGGSFTRGKDCKKGLSATEFLHSESDKDCAWPARFTQWLRAAFPQANIHTNNMAGRGTPSSVILGGIGLQNYSKADMILVDTLVNDAYQGNLRPDLKSTVAVSVPFEELLRSLHVLAPDSLLFAMEAGCWKCIDAAELHRKVLDFYGIPYMDFSRAVQGVPELWTSKYGPHPNFKTHQAVADIMAFNLRAVWDSMLSMKEKDSEPRLDFSKAYHDEEERNNFPRRLYPCFVMSAFHPPADQPKVLQGNWTLYEDVPGKPGWISTEPGSVMQIDLCFGKLPTLTFTYLKSYEKMGAARLIMNGKSMEVSGLWDFKVSQSETFFFQAGSLSRKIFSVEPNSSQTLRVENLRSGNGKMKVMEIVSC
ncbi:Hypothetical protein SCF082_LOCUS16389 [Durusdinium trenchii]|uniref:Uncharacterized protein n=1 Tax=Durusdinium trenchii TaxID=1381693 RepID=A0ABP0KCV8_9DINO